MEDGRQMGEEGLEDRSGRVQRLERALLRFQLGQSRWLLEAAEGSRNCGSGLKAANFSVEIWDELGMAAVRGEV